MFVRSTYEGLRYLYNVAIASSTLDLQSAATDLTAVRKCVQISNFRSLNFRIIRFHTNNAKICTIRKFPAIRYSEIFLHHLIILPVGYFYSGVLNYKGGSNKPVQPSNQNDDQHYQNNGDESSDKPSSNGTAIRASTTTTYVCEQILQQLKE